MPRIAVFPGSFDPITLGHLDLIRRAERLFDELHVVVVHNPAKTSVLTAAARLDLIRASIAQTSGGTTTGGAGKTGPSSGTAASGARTANPEAKITLAQLDSGLLVDYCKRVGATVLIKGLRSSADVEYELPMSVVNRDLADVETVFLLADPSVSHISSSLVRQVANFGGDVSRYVPAPVVDLLSKR